MWSLSKNYDSNKKTSFQRRRESSLFDMFWIPRSSLPAYGGATGDQGLRMTTAEFLDKLCIVFFSHVLP